VRSFDAEAAPNGTADYTWSNVKPGTYLYQSGTQVQVQVQMGLYGALSKNAVDADALGGVRAQAYMGATYGYDNQATLLYSEIDPAMHDAVANGSYGPSGTVTSTFNYAPKYFLINGQPYPINAVIAPSGNQGATLLRLLNAGLVTHVPMIQGTHWTVMAEDGKPYPYSASQYTALLPAAKTLDVMLTPDVGGARYAILDRRLNLSNSGLSDGGMLAVLSYAAQGVGGALGTADGNVAPVAVPDAFSTVRGVTLTVGAPGVLANDDNTDGLPQVFKVVAGSGTTTNGSTYTLHANGSLSYIPALGFSGTESFDYTVTDGKALSVAATVTMTVSVPTAPTTLALLDDFERLDSTSLGASSSAAVWSQQVSTGTSVPDVGVSSGAAKANTTGLGGLAVLNQVFLETQGASFSSSSPLVNSALVLKATGGTATTSPANFVRVRCEATGGGELVVATMMGGSNVSVFVKQAAFPESGCLSTGSLSAVVDAKGLVTAFLNGSFVGGVQLPDVAAWKAPGKIGVQLQTQGVTVDNFLGGSL
jgi:hypothetical protein